MAEPCGFSYGRSGRAGRWLDHPVTPPADFEYAKATGVMCDPIDLLTHDETVSGVREAVAAVNERGVSGAFLASLASRRLELRSALGSYAVARHLPAHDLVPWEFNHDGSRVQCGSVERGASSRTST